MTLRPIVFADANILIPRVLRDYVLYADEAEAIFVTWSELVLDEMTKNIASSHLIDGESHQKRAENAFHLRSVMQRYFEDATVEIDEKAAAAVANVPMDDKDRHVLAAAISARGTILLTENDKDFPTREALAEAGLTIRILTFVQFLRELLVDNPDGLRRAHHLTVQNLRGATDRDVLRRLWNSSGARHPGAVRAVADTLGLRSELDAVEQSGVARRWNRPETDAD